MITQLDTNFSINQCVATGDPTFCNLITRFTDVNNAGIVYVFRQPTVNLGTLETDGIDVGARYALRDTAAGSFNFQIDWTHINKYDNLPAERCGDRPCGGYV